jgi:hypothetical protein
VKGGVDVDVLAAAELPAEAGRQLDQRGDAATAGSGAPLQRNDPGENPERGGLPGTVAPDDPDRLTWRDVERDAGQRLSRGKRSGSPAA